MAPALDFSPAASGLVGTRKVVSLDLKMYVGAEDPIDAVLVAGDPPIDLAIRGRDGMILGATVEPGRRRFQRCLESYLEDVRFPSFASPRMGARYRFHTS